mgnify:CR=1 FL=1
MERIDQYSRMTILFTLRWNSEDASHEEQLWADPVSLWRDVLDPGLVKELLAAGVGGRAREEIAADRFFAPPDPRKRILVTAGQFRGTDGHGNPLIPIPGRYYPQGMLSGVGGVYKVTTSPCRYLGEEGGQLRFDLNHPLAGRALTLEAEIVAVHPRHKERGGRCEDWLERISSDGPGMQARFLGSESPFFRNTPFPRADDQPDPLFYQQPRLVHHFDRTAEEEISRRYALLIQPGSQVLDLMGSWTSHLPDSLAVDGLTVLGLNDEELRRNQRATETLVHDLNTDPHLPFGEARFDAVICTASVEYLIDPLAVMSEIYRVLKPGGVLAFAFSNRWFPPKAIRPWTEMHEFERLGLVADLFHVTGNFGQVTTLSRRGLPRPVDDPHQELWLSDPVYMVWGTRQ